MIPFPQVLTLSNGQEFILTQTINHESIYTSNDIFQMTITLIDNEGFTGLASWLEDSNDDGIRYFTDNGHEEN